MKKISILLIIILAVFAFFNCVDPESGSVTIYNQHSTNVISAVTEYSYSFAASHVSPIQPGSSATIVSAKNEKNIKKYYVWVGTNIIGYFYLDPELQKSYYYKADGSFVESSSN